MSIQRQQLGEERTLEESAIDTGSDPAMLAAGGSVVLALYTYFSGRRELGIFVGLWAPTILGFASYYNQRQIRERLEYVTSSGGLLDTLDQFVSRR